MSKDTRSYIVSAKVSGSVPHHDMERGMVLGPSHVFMEDSMVGEADLRVAGRQVDQVPPAFKPYVEAHTHSVSQVYAILGDLAVEVILNGERHEVSGPSGVFIPAGTTHSITPLRGSGYLLAITREGKYR